MTRTQLGQSGPSVLVLVADLDPDVRPRPAGFTADLNPHPDRPEAEPLLWAGDQA